MGIIERFEERPRVLTHLDTDEFATSLRMAIRYHHRSSSDIDDGDGPPQAQVSQVIDPDFIALLRDAFDTSLYVARKAAERLLEFSLRSSTDVVVLSGERGSGKTTLWDRAARLPDKIGLNADTEVAKSHRGIDPYTHIGPRSETWVRQGDPRITIPDLPTASLMYYSAREPDFPRSSNANDVASSIISGLLGAFVTTSDARSAWKRYRYLHSRAFAVVRTEYGDEPDEAPESDVRAARERLMNSEAEDALVVLLRFVQRLYSHRVVFVVDNLDSEPPNHRVELAKIFARFARALSAGRNRVSLVLPLRPRNASEVADAIESVIDGSVIEFPLGLQVEDELSALAADETTTDGVGTKAHAVELIAGFLDTRLTFVTEWLGQRGDDLATKNREVLELFCAQAIHASRNHNLIEHFTAWYNGSLRAIAEAFERIMLDALSGVNPISNPQSIMNLMQNADPTSIQWIQRVRIVTRLHTLRKFVFSVDRDDAKIPSVRRIPAALPFIRLSRSAHRCGIVFLKIHILEFLRRREHPTTLAVLHDIFLRHPLYGVKPEEVNRALRELASRRYTGDSGLLEVEGWNTRTQETPVLEPQDITIGLQWAGEYLIDTLAHTSDYLFWAAAASDETGALFNSAASVLGESINSDTLVPFRLLEVADFRFAVAALFLVEFLLPRFTTELPVLAMEDMDQRETREHYTRFMNDFGAGIFLVKTLNVMVGFLSDLVGAGLLERTEARELRNLLSPVHDYLELLRHNGAHWVGNLNW